MAQSVVVSIGSLDPGLILASERYDPRRTLAASNGTSLGNIVEVVTDLVSSKQEAGASSLLVLDTGHAVEGVISQPSKVIGASELGSSKKRVLPGDVIISRLRPYLRQVAFADAALFQINGQPVEIVGSTEFFILRARDGRSIAFLVPILLSEPVQKQLAASQEGGHHPRFNLVTLLGVTITQAFLDSRTELSERVESAVSWYRRSQQALRNLCRSEEQAEVAVHRRLSNTQNKQESLRE